MAPILPSPRVLSVQSHVVSGYCGNKAATFPLQLLEFEVDVLNTVQLSNHTQYEIAPGQIFGANDLEGIYTGLKKNNLLGHYDHVLSGYVADVGYIEAMARMIKDIKQLRSAANQDFCYTFDPVLGDDGVGFYVPNAAAVAEAYKKHLLPLADILTPNRFEASILSGIDIDGSSDKALPQALEAIKALHSFGVRVVVITSFQLKGQEDQLTCILSHNPSAGQRSQGGDQLDGLGKPEDKTEAWLVRIPKLDLLFTGTGDLFAALITAWLRKTDFNFKKSLENTANSIHAILEDTLAWAQYIGDGSILSSELRLVQNKDKVICPNQRFKAETITSVI